jgi:hypothetical protein
LWGRGGDKINRDKNLIDQIRVTNFASLGTRKGTKQFNSQGGQLNHGLLEIQRNVLPKCWKAVKKRKRFALPRYAVGSLTNF